MTIDERKIKLVILGNFLDQFSSEGASYKPDIIDARYYELLDQAVESAVHHNGWFTRENVLFALEQWSQALTLEKLEKWIAPYDFSKTRSKTVGLVMAGNIPLVGFHDFLSVLISGHKAVIKLSSNDRLLLPAIVQILIEIAPEFKECIQILPESHIGDSRLKNHDAVIATGSNNTARYFEYYFAGKPSIIRKNRNSVAVLTGKETEEELAQLGEDIFRYYGLGCRNVSKLYVPENYVFDDFFKAIYPWHPIINQAKYANNYDYNKAVYLMSQYKLLENGFLMLKEDSSLSSPIATLFYEQYQGKDQIREQVEARQEEIQCIVSRDLFENEVAFGQTQHPELWDYADNVDTLAFLTEKL